MVITTSSVVSLNRKEEVQSRIICPRTWKKYWINWGDWITVLRFWDSWTSTIWFNYRQACETEEGYDDALSEQWNVFLEVDDRSISSMWYGGSYCWTSRIHSRCVREVSTCSGWNKAGPYKWPKSITVSWLKADLRGFADYWRSHNTNDEGYEEEEDANDQNDHYHSHGENYDDVNNNNDTTNDDINDDNDSSFRSSNHGGSNGGGFIADSNSNSKSDGNGDTNDAIEIPPPLRTDRIPIIIENPPPSKDEASPSPSPPVLPPSSPALPPSPPLVHGEDYINIDNTNGNNNNDDMSNHGEFTEGTKGGEESPRWEEHPLTTRGLRSQQRQQTAMTATTTTTKTTAAADNGGGGRMNGNPTIGCQWWMTIKNLMSTKQNLVLSPEQSLPIREAMPIVSRKLWRQSIVYQIRHRLLRKQKSMFKWKRTMKDWRRKQLHLNRKQQDWSNSSIKVQKGDLLEFIVDVQQGYEGQTWQTEKAKRQLSAEEKDHCATQKKSKRLTTEKGSTLLWELDHQEDLTGNESRCEADLEWQVVAAIKELAGEKEKLAAVKEGRRLSTEGHQGDMAAATWRQADLERR